MEKNKMVPEIRFPEFNDEWNINKTEILIQSGNSYPINSYLKSGVLLIQGLNIYPGKLNLTNPIFVDKNSNNNRHVAIKEGDIILGLNRPIINNNIKACLFTLAEAYLYQRAGVLKFSKKHIHNTFLYQYIRSEIFLKKLTLELVGSDQPYIKSNLFEITKNYFALLPEQKKIAKFLSSIDQRIQLLEERKEKLQAYKKGVMQQIFSQQIRFKQEDGSDFPEWEEKKLKDIATITKGKGISKNDITENGIYYCIRYGELYTHYDEIISEVLNKTNSCDKNLIFSETNDVIIPSSGETHLDIAKASCILKDGVILGGDLNIIRSEMNGVFLSYYLNHSQKYDISKLAQGSSVIHLYASHLLSLKIIIPSLPEQNKISSFIQSISKRINQTQSQIDKTKEFKKGLLQKMFV